jgi:hypothetical protein
MDRRRYVGISGNEAEGDGMTAPWILPADIAAKGARDNATRYTLIETAVRLYLATIPLGRVLTTAQMAIALAAPGANLGDVKSVLLKHAKYMKDHPEIYGGRFATQDGHKGTFRGHPSVAWRWHGQLERGVEK